MKRTLLPVLLIAALAGVIALGADNAPAKASPGKNTSSMKIRIKLGEKTLTATLADNATSRDFVSLLPLTLTLKNYAATEKISDLPKKLSIQGAPARYHPRVGDITYYAPWGNLAIFYKDGHDSDGLIRLGKIDGDVEALKTPGEQRATIEVIE